MVHEERARLAGTRHDVDDPRRQLGLAEQIGEQQRAERRRLGRLEYDGVARREGWGDLPREHEEREVPRDHLGGNAVGLGVAAESRVLELVRPARVVEEVRGGRRDVDVARLADRLAVVEGLQDGELAAALCEQARDPVQILGALGARHPAPHLVVGAARGGDGAVDVGLARLGDVREDLFRGGVDRLEGLALGRVGELAVDEQSVRRRDVDDGAGLGGRGVLEVAHVSCLQLTVT